MLISCTELLLLTLDARDFYGVCCNYKYQYCMKICSLNGRIPSSMKSRLAGITWKAFFHYSNNFLLQSEV